MINGIGRSQESCDEVLTLVELEFSDHFSYLIEAS